MAAPQSPIDASVLSRRVFNTMDPGTIEISGLKLFQEFEISPSVLTEGFDSKEHRFPDYFKGVMQRYFFSYMAALHLADTYFIEEVSRPDVDYETSKNKFLTMIQELPETLLKNFFKRNDHALKNIPCNLSQEELFDIGKKAFDVITKNGHDFYNTKILEHVDSAFQKTKNHIEKEVKEFFNLDENKPSHKQVVISLGEQLQTYLESEEGLHQDHVKAICQFLSGAYTVVELPAEQQSNLEEKTGLFCPQYHHAGKSTLPIIYRAMLFEIFLPLEKDLPAQSFCKYVGSIGIEHLAGFRKHLDKANRLVFALDQLRIRYQNLLGNTPS